MKVLVLTNMFPTADRPSFGIFVAEQVEDLARAGVDVEVLRFDGTQDRREYVRARRRLVRRLRGAGFDLVHAHYGLTGAVAVTQRSVPVVTTFHGGDYTGLSRWQAVVSRVVARLCTPIVVSAEGAHRLGQPEVRVIPAGVDTERFAPIDRHAARGELGWQPEGPYAVLLGARHLANKRADLFDAAVGRAREERPELAGVALDGFSREDVRLVLNAADVAVMCSDTEGSPVAVREALACRTPVVGVDVGDVAEVLDGLPGCAVVARDPNALGAALLQALKAGRPAELRARAEETARPRVCGRLLEVYHEVMAVPA